MGSPPEDAATRTLLDFQAVMQQFLDLQRQVFGAALLLQEPAVIQEPAVADDPLLAAPVPAPEEATAAAAIEAPPAVAIAWSSPPQVGEASASTAVDAEPRKPLRLALRAAPRLQARSLGGLAAGHGVLIGADNGAVAVALAERLRAGGHHVVVARRGTACTNDGATFTSPLASLRDVEALVAAVRDAHGPIGAYVHLLPLSPVDDLREIDATGWWERVRTDTCTLFWMAKVLGPSLSEAGERGGAALVVATAMGGAFASDPHYRPASFFPGAGGVVGFAKSLALEWPKVRVTAVDLDPGEPAASLAAHIDSELWAIDTDVEIGYAKGQRLTLEVRAAPPVPDPSFQIASDSVVLATGGARGITAEICLDVATRYQPTIVVVGQTGIPDQSEPADTASLTAPADIKRALLQRLRAVTPQVNLSLVEKAYQQLQREREIRDTIGRLTAAGARVHYVALDVRDADAFGALIDDIYATYGRLDGIIHGAGIIEDKLVQDKSPESFERVLSTKVVSALVLARKVRPESLRFMVFFASVAGRFGNRGQADYAAANEVISKLAVYLNGRWPARVCSIAWAPWDKRGMVSDALKRQFAERGVALLSPEAGCTAFLEEIQQSPADGAEIVIAGSAQAALSGPARSAERTPLLKHARRSLGHDGSVQFERTLDLNIDRYLADHRLDGVAVLPLAVATEFMAEAAQATWPDMHVVGVKGLQLLKGITIESAPVPITIRVRMPVYSRDAEHTEADVEVQAPTLMPPMRYRCVVVLADRAAVPPPFARPAWPVAPLPISLEQAYRDWTFHGPLFQRLTAVEGIGAESMIGRLFSSSGVVAIADVARASWIIDPFVFDAALQMLLIWSRAQNDMTALPSRFRAFYCYGPLSDDAITCYVHVNCTAGGHALQSDVHFVDSEGRLMALLEGMEASCSAALNRLAVR